MNRKTIQKNEKILFSSSSNFDEDPDYQTLKALYTKIKDKYKVPSIEIISSLDKKEILIPSSVFNKKLSAFESIVKYLKENLELPNREIALLISKSQKSVWQTYHFAKKKFPSVFEITTFDCYIPVSALKSQFTVLESIVKFLKESLVLNYREIGNVLQRDERTIWTIYQRAKNK